MSDLSSMLTYISWDTFREQNAEQLSKYGAQFLVQNLGRGKDFILKIWNGLFIKKFQTEGVTEVELAQYLENQPENFKEQINSILIRATQDQTNEKINAWIDILIDLTTGNYTLNKRDKIDTYSKILKDIGLVEMAILTKSYDLGSIDEVKIKSDSNGVLDNVISYFSKRSDIEVDVIYSAFQRLGNLGVLTPYYDRTGLYGSDYRSLEQPIYKLNSLGKGFLEYLNSTRHILKGFEVKTQE